MEEHGALERGFSKIPFLSERKENNKLIFLRLSHTIVKRAVQAKQEGTSWKDTYSKTICTFSNNFPGYLRHTQIDYKFHLYAASCYYVVGWLDSFLDSAASNILLFSENIFISNRCMELLLPDNFGFLSVN